MDKAEQPTTQALKPCPVVEAIAQEIADRSPWKKTTDNYARIYQAAYAGAIAALNTRTTSLAAQEVDSGMSGDAVAIIPFTNPLLSSEVRR